MNKILIKTFFLSILIYILSFNLRAQQLPVYSNFTTEFIRTIGYYFELKLYPNGRYILYYGKEFGDDMFHWHEFLKGNYTVVDIKLTLIDEHTKLQFEYKCIYDTIHYSPDYHNLIDVKIILIPTNTFRFLKNFAFKGSTMTYPDTESPYGPNYLSHQINDNFIQLNKYQKLNIGNYRLKDSNVRIKLNIEKGKRYFLYSSGFHLSSGKWRKKGDKLILQDSILNQEIYGTIGNNCILLDTGYELQYVKE